jgi:hypothetical protein
MEYVSEILTLAKALKKFSVLILCFHKCQRLISSSLLSLADVVFVGNNKSKDYGMALCDIILGKQTPYAKVNINKSEPFDYECLSELPLKKYDAFGLGLSFVNISYVNARLSEYTAKIGEKVHCSVDLINPSHFHLFEIAQLYVVGGVECKPQILGLSTVEILPNGKASASFILDTQDIDYSQFEDSTVCRFYLGFGKNSKDLIKIPFTVIF